MQLLYQKNIYFFLDFISLVLKPAQQFLLSLGKIRYQHDNKGITTSAIGKFDSFVNMDSWSLHNCAEQVKLNISYINNKKYFSFNHLIFNIHNF
jgi:hypothetical protein